MKKILFSIALILVVVVGIAGWIFLGSATGFSAAREYLYVPTGAATKEAVLDSLEKNKLVTNLTAFSFLANRLGYWETIKPGRYEIKKGSSLVDIVRNLHNGKQAPVNLIITKLRTKEDFARLAGNKFEFDAAQMLRFLNSADSLKQFHADTSSAMWPVLPDTYTFLWNTTPSFVYERLYQESKKFWNKERIAKAARLNLSPEQAYTLASIVEEETNNNDEKDTIASVYLNRIKAGMYLGADPTLKYALRDFSIKWIHGAMLDVVSPYNTYKNKGLPPGPICTPSRRTIEEVLNAPATSYLYFVANSAFNGTHLFSTNFQEHLAKARAFQLEDKRRREARQQIDAANKK